MEETSTSHDVEYNVHVIYIYDPTKLQTKTYIIIIENLLIKAEQYGVMEQGYASIEGDIFDGLSSESLFKIFDMASLLQ